MRIGLCCSVSLTLFISVCSSRQITGAGEAAFFDSTSNSDAIRLTMTGVSVPSPGTAYFAWLVADNDVQYTKLGQLTVQGNGGVLLTYRDNGGANLLATNKKLLITQESVPFSGIVPTLASIRWADSLSGPGIPPASSALAQIRDCLVSFSNTYQTFGLALVFKIDSSDYVAHAGFARDGANGNNVANARLHSDHVFDFIMGHLTGLVAGNSSVVAHTDPVGYGFRRYWELGTHDSTKTGAGALGGAGYHVSLAINSPTATTQMIKEGSSALTALRNAFGAQNDSGLARKVTDRATNIINGNYVTGQLVTEGTPFYLLTLQLLRGTVSSADTTSATGGIVQAYYHVQRMATFILKPFSSTSAPAATGTGITPERFALHQNFPNPFNPSTEVAFDVPVQSRIWVSVYNILGQEVSRLIDGLEYNPGSYKMTWHSTAASGVYLCRLMAKDSEENRSRALIRRMILLR